MSYDRISSKPFDCKPCPKNSHTHFITWFSKHIQTHPHCRFPKTLFLENDLVLCRLLYFMLPCIFFPTDIHHNGLSGFMTHESVEPKVSKRQRRKQCWFFFSLNVGVRWFFFFFNFTDSQNLMIVRLIRRPDSQGLSPINPESRHEAHEPDLLSGIPNDASAGRLRTVV